jgi:hypothetical protein
MKRAWSWISTQLGKRKLGLYVLFLVIMQVYLTFVLADGIYTSSVLLSENQIAIYEHIDAVCTPRTF